MLKKLIVVGLFLSGSFAIAQSYPWIVAYESQETSSTTAGFLLLQKKYPFYQTYQADQVASADVTTRVYEYTGTTSCPANDPRLLSTNVAYGLCQKATGGNGNSNGACFEEAVRLPDPKDPCAN